MLSNIFSPHRYIEVQSSHKKQHVELHELFQSFESRLNECLLLKATSFEECLEQQEKAKVCSLSAPIGAVIFFSYLRCVCVCMYAEK